MKITLTSTDQIVELNGVPARIWTGTTESGIEIHAFITRVAVSKDADTTQFDKEFIEHDPPHPVLDAVYPTRLTL